jgi:hypothetical protein
MADGDQSPVMASSPAPSRSCRRPGIGGGFSCDWQATSLEYMADAIALMAT